MDDSALLLAINDIRHVTGLYKPMLSELGEEVKKLLSQHDTNNTSKREHVITQSKRKSIRAEADDKLMEMYAVLNDSNRWCKHVETIREALKESD